MSFNQILRAAELHCTIVIVVATEMNFTLCTAPIIVSVCTWASFTYSYIGLPLLALLY